MEIKTLNDRIEEAADRAWTKEIEEAWCAFGSVINRNGVDLYNFTIEGPDGKPIVLNGWNVVERLKSHIFNQERDRHRQQAIANFLEKVESLDAQLDELRNEIQSQ